MQDWSLAPKKHRYIDDYSRKSASIHKLRAMLMNQRNYEDSEHKGRRVLLHSHGVGDAFPACSSSCILVDEGRGDHVHLA